MDFAKIFDSASGFTPGGAAADFVKGLGGQSTATSGDATSGGSFGPVNIGGIGLGASSVGGIPAWVIVAGVAVLAFIALRK